MSGRNGNRANLESKTTCKQDQQNERNKNQKNAFDGELGDVSHEQGLMPFHLDVELFVKTAVDGIQNEPDSIAQERNQDATDSKNG